MTYRYQLETNSSTKTCSYVNLSLTTLSTSNLFTRQLVNPSTRTKTFLCYFVFNYPVYKQLVHLSTRTKTLCLNKRIYIYIIRRQKSVKFNYFSNLLICRSLAIICKQGKLLICRHSLQTTDLQNITNKENQAK